MKGNERKVRRIGKGNVIEGFEGEKEEELKIMERIEEKIEKYKEKIMRD